LSRFFLTTAIDYVNSRPHLGTAYEKIAADVIARYKRLAGVDTRFLMGNDEHSQNVYKKALDEGLDPLAYCDQMEQEFRATWRRLDISFDDFIRTTEPRHKAGVTELARRIFERGDIHEGVYEGWYCVSCEEFKQEKDLVGGRCPLHPTIKPEWISEKNYFFRLSKYQQPLLDHFAAHPEFLQPEIRRNEILRFIEAGLEDISVSRAGQSWGIPLPFDPGSVVYVWFDALINYLSATGFPDTGYERLWPADLHVVGKGITRFHCIIWPAMLLAAGLELPKLVWAHGYVQWEGTKMSKTAGTAVSLKAAIERHGADALRYFLLREVGFESDGNFTWDRFDARYTADLADTFGNLVSRALSMVQRYRDGTVPELPVSGTARPERSEGDSLEQATQETIAAYTRAMDAQELQHGAALVIELASRANRYVEETAPWKLAKEKKDAELDSVLANLVRAVARLAVLAGPFIPGKAPLVWGALGASQPFERVGFADLTALPVTGQRVAKPPPLFPKPDAAQGGLPKGR